MSQSMADRMETVSDRNGLYVLESTDALAHYCRVTGLTLMLLWWKSIALTLINFIIPPIWSDTQ